MAVNLHSTFGAALKAVRQEKGLTQQELADRIGMHRVELAKLEGNVHKPTWRTVQRLGTALGVSCERFVSLEDVADMAKPKEEQVKEPQPKRSRPRQPRPSKGG
jgi:transcriptional regulator with XRE-family HTH domain